jgi:hypothetical protein
LVGLIVDRFNPEVAKLNPSVNHRGLGRLDDQRLVFRESIAARNDFDRDACFDLVVPIIKPIAKDEPTRTVAAT